MTRTEIIELVNQLTERKAESVLSLPLLYTQVLQEICGENRFWWRKRTFSFNTVANQAQYDLTSIVTTPTLTDISVEEFVRVYYVENPTTLTQLSPIFEDDSIAESFETAETGEPAGYGIDYTDYKTLRIFPCPNAVYKIRVVAWCVVNPSTESTSEAVPLLPTWIHRAVVHGMEKYIWRVVYGMEDPKTVTAQAAYDKAMIQAQMRPQFTTNFSQQLISAEDSIQSTV